MRFRTALAALAVACSPAFAGAPYDGIYQVGASSEYVSVREQNGFVIAAYFYTNPATNGILWNLANGQTYVAPRVDNWDLLSGPVVYGVASVQGETAFGACTVNAQIDFSNLTFRFLTFTATQSGLVQGVNCPNLLAIIVRNRGGFNFAPLSKRY